MKIAIFLSLLLLTAVLPGAAQTTAPTPTPADDAKKTDDAPKTTPVPTPTPAASTYVRPDKATRRKEFVNSVVGPWALARTVVGAGVATARNEPEEWGGKWEGFGRRFASNFGRNAIRQTTSFALEEAFKLDGRFYRSRRRTVGAKLSNAVVSPFTARTKSGRRVFGFPRIVGTYAGSVIAAEAWFPKRFDYKDGLRNGTISLGFNVVFNIIREFVRR